MVNLIEQCFLKLNFPSNGSIYKRGSAPPSFIDETATEGATAAKIPLEALPAAKATEPGRN